MTASSEKILQSPRFSACWLINRSITVTVLILILNMQLLSLISSQSNVLTIHLYLFFVMFISYKHACVLCKLLSKQSFVLQRSEVYYCRSFNCSMISNLFVYLLLQSLSLLSKIFNMTISSFLYFFNDCLHIWTNYFQIN